MLQNRTFHFAATKELGCSVGRQFRLLDFTAQTTLASSYGLLRISYITAIGAVKWEALNNAWNPSCLFDTKANWANGGGSLAPGTGYLANLFFNENVNPDLGPSNPAFSAPDDFVNAFTNAFNYYNHNTTGGPYGQNIVNTYAPQYMPVPSAPIFVIAGVALGAVANAGLRAQQTPQRRLAAQQSRDRSLVGQYLPQKLLESPYGGEPYPYETAFVAADLNGTGRRDFHFRPGTQKRRRLGGAG